MPEPGMMRPPSIWQQKRTTPLSAPFSLATKLTLMLWMRTRKMVNLLHKRTMNCYKSITFGCVFFLGLLAESSFCKIKYMYMAQCPRHVNLFFLIQKCAKSNLLKHV